MNEEVRDILLGWSKQNIERRLDEIDKKHDEYLASVGGNDEEEDGEE